MSGLQPSDSFWPETQGWYVPGFWPLLPEHHNHGEKYAKVQCLGFVLSGLKPGPISETEAL